MRPWRVLVVDDHADHRRQVLEAVRGLTHAQAAGGFSVEEESAFDRGATRASQERFDIVILDIRKDGPQADDQAGINVLKRYSLSTFVPTIFYSAVAHLAHPKESLFVAAVRKSDGVAALLTCISELLETRLLALRDHLDVVQREMLWAKLPDFMSSVGKGLPRIEACGQLARSLARELESPAVREILGLSTKLLHPAECYILPSSAPYPVTGDLYQQAGSPVKFWVVLNPSCDLVEDGPRSPKVKEVLLAKCKSAMDANVITNWKAKRAATPKASPEKSAEAVRDEQIAADEAKYVLSNQEPSRHLLPGMGTFPDFLVDFRVLKLVPFDDLAKAPWQRVASLSSPFAESLNSRFAHFFSRVGVPDIDPQIVQNRLLGLTNPG